MLRPLCTLQLPGSLLKQFQEFGFNYCEDVCRYNSQKVPEFNSTAEKIISNYCSEPSEYWNSLISCPSNCSALDLLKRKENQFETKCGIETFSSQLDGFLEGGIPLNKITEFTGAPGSGKTQLCLQLCVDVQIPHAFCGQEGQAVFIDTCNNFSVARLMEIGEACVKHCENIAENTKNPELSEALERFCKTSILKNVFYFLCADFNQLAASVIYLRDFLSENNRVRLVVIDNITFPLQNISNSLQRRKLVYELVGNLRDIATSSNVAVVLTNNLTTKIGIDGKSTLAPALGESFGHCINNRFLLGHIAGNNFACTNLKNLFKQSTTVHFKITKSGVRDIEED